MKFFIILIAFLALIAGAIFSYTKIQSYQSRVNTSDYSAFDATPTPTPTEGL